MDEITGPVDAAIHMTLCREMHHSSRSVPFQKLVHQRAIIDVPAHKGMSRVTPECRQVAEASGVSQQI
jgi:hypothetical protein